MDAWLLRFGLVASHTLGQCQDQLCHVCLSQARLSRCRWHGRAHSKNLGGPVKSFLLALRYDCRDSHYLLSFTGLGISAIETVYITPNVCERCGEKSAAVLGGKSSRPAERQLPRKPLLLGTWVNKGKKKGRECYKRSRPSIVPAQTNLERAYIPSYLARSPRVANPVYGVGRGSALEEVIEAAVLCHLKVYGSVYTARESDARGGWLRDPTFLSNRYRNRRRSSRPDTQPGTAAWWRQ
jgi:hypothetical protein